MSGTFVKSKDPTLAITDEQLASVYDRLEATESGCLIWLGPRKQKGYGRYTFGTGKNQWRQPVHRLMYRVLIGPVPDGLVLDHLCRNPPCANPAHLEPVTNGENIKRGVNPIAVNAAKTHCSNGHEFNDENMKRGPNNTRICKICRTEASRRRRAENPEVRRRDRERIARVRAQRRASDAA